jgi:predicted acetyltransferase
MVPATEFLRVQDECKKMDNVQQRKQRPLALQPSFGGDVGYKIKQKMHGDGNV